LKQLFFVRHGQTEWNAAARMQGQWNSDLNDLGRAQADVNGRLLAGLDIQMLFASPLDRTRQTAQIVNRHLDVPVAYDDRIKEWDCGDWSGYLYAEVKAKWADEWAALEADRFHYRGPNCENYPDMIRRSTPFLEEIQAHAARNIAIVSHGMIGRVMVSTLLGFDAARMLSFHQGNDVVFRITLNDQSVTVDHYVGGEGPFEGVHETQS
jgi:broad specificity phosphatase PhoE